MDDSKFSTLTHLVDTFGVQNDNLKQLKTEVEAKNKEIKEIMSSEKLDYFSTGDYSATYKVKQTTKVNEDKLLYLLQTVDGDNFRKLGIIQTKEYIDSDALETAIFNGIFDAEMLRKIQECSTVVETPTLTVKKKGK